MKHNKKSVFITMILLLSIITNIMLMISGGGVDKILIKLGLQTSDERTDWTLESWKHSLAGLNFDSDIVFFGDSLTSNGDWQLYFPEYNIVNLGLIGDNIQGMNSRIDMIEEVSPEKIFIMAGINSLANKNYKECLQDYEKMISDIQNLLPESSLYIQSVLPVSNEKENQYITNLNIDDFNHELKILAEKNEIIFIDMSRFFKEDCELKQTLTVDGIHINEDGYNVWSSCISQYVYESKSL